MGDKELHTLQLAMLLLIASFLIVYAHAWIPPEVVFTSMIAGQGSIIGSRIASNGYTISNAPPAPPAIAPPAPPVG